MQLLPSWRCAHLQPGKKDKYEDITGALRNENLRKADECMTSWIVVVVEFRRSSPICKSCFRSKVLSFLDGVLDTEVTKMT